MLGNFVLDLGSPASNLVSWLPWQRMPVQNVHGLRNFLPADVLTSIAIKNDGMGVEKRCIIAFTICFSSCLKKQIQWEGFYSVFSDTENNFLFILLTFLFLISLLPLFFQYTHLYFSFSSLYQAECLIHMYFILLFCTLSYSLLFVHWYRMSFCYRLSEKAALPFLPFTFHFYLSLLL